MPLFQISYPVYAPWFNFLNPEHQANSAPNTNPPIPRNQIRALYYLTSTLVNGLDELYQLILVLCNQGQGKQNKTKIRKCLHRSFFLSFLFCFLYHHRVLSPWCDEVPRNGGIMYLPHVKCEHSQGLRYSWGGTLPISLPWLYLAFTPGLQLLTRAEVYSLSSSHHLLYGPLNLQFFLNEFQLPHILHPLSVGWSFPLASLINTALGTIRSHSSENGAHIGTIFQSLN